MMFCAVTYSEGPTTRNRRPGISIGSPSTSFWFISTVMASFSAPIESAGLSVNEPFAMIT